MSPSPSTTSGREALVKVIVPCYGYGHLLEGCLESVLGQQGVEVRALVVDDRSPDDGAAVAERIVARDGRVELLRNERNLGLIGTANRGLDWASDADYVVLLSADDLLAPGALARAASVMEAHPEVGMVYGHAPQFSSNDSLPRLGRRWRGTKVFSGRDWIRRRCRSGKNCVASPEVVVRASVQCRVGGYSDANPNTSDLNMWLRIAAVADVAYVKGASQALYRMHDASMFRTMLDGGGLISDLSERRGAFESFLADPPPELTDPTSLRATIARTLAREALWEASRAYDRGDLDEGPAVEELVRFAEETCPQAHRLAEWRGLRLRRRLGAGRSLWFPPFLATGLAHRLQGHLRWLRWRLVGV